MIPSFTPPYAGAYPGKGKPRKYGERPAPETLAEARLKTEAVEKNIRTRIDQVRAWHRHFPGLLNVAVIVKAGLKTGRCAKALLFGDDLALSSEALIDYYSPRFQIEFNFRDAKQYWGLEDFMSAKETQVGNAANFSLSMVTFSQLLTAKMEGLGRGGMLDVKTVFRARKYTRRIINSLGKNGEAFLTDEAIFQTAEIGRIHAKAA